MKKNKIVFWSSTGIIGLMMVFSAFSYFTNPQVAEGFKHLGFPDYFRVELGVAKAIAVLVLLMPQISNRIKEWAYAGLFITFVSASIAHFNTGDAMGAVVTPIVMLGILAVSYIFKEKVALGSN